MRDKDRRAGADFLSIGQGAHPVPDLTGHRRADAQRFSRRDPDQSD